MRADAEDHLWNGNTLSVEYFRNKSGRLLKCVTLKPAPDCDIAMIEYANGGRNCGVTIDLGRKKTEASGG